MRYQTALRSDRGEALLTSTTPGPQCDDPPGVGRITGVSPPNGPHSGHDRLRRPAGAPGVHAVPQRQDRAAAALFRHRSRTRTAASAWRRSPGSCRFATAKPGLIRELAAARTDPVLFDWSYDYVGDLAETVALMWPANPTQRRPRQAWRRWSRRWKPRPKSALPGIVGGVAGRDATPPPGWRC